MGSQIESVPNRPVAVREGSEFPNRPTHTYGVGTGRNVSDPSRRGGS